MNPPHRIYFAWENDFWLQTTLSSNPRWRQLRNWYMHDHVLWRRWVANKAYIKVCKHVIIHLAPCSRCMCACDVLMNLLWKSCQISLEQFVVVLAGDVLIVAGVYVQYDGPLTRGDPGTFISSLFISLGGHDKMLSCLRVWWIRYASILITNGSNNNRVCCAFSCMMKSVQLRAERRK